MMYRPTSTLSLGELTVAVDLPNHFMGLGAEPVQVSTIAPIVQTSPPKNPFPGLSFFRVGQYGSLIGSGLVGWYTYKKVNKTRNPFIGLAGGVVSVGLLGFGLVLTGLASMGGDAWGLK